MHPPLFVDTLSLSLSSPSTIQSVSQPASQPRQLIAQQEKENLVTIAFNRAIGWSYLPIHLPINLPINLYIYSINHLCRSYASTSQFSNGRPR